MVDCDCDSATTSRLSVKEQKVAARFERMLKMMIPPQAVPLLHEMEKNGVEQKIVFAILGQDKVEQKYCPPIHPEKIASTVLATDILAALLL